MDASTALGMTETIEGCKLALSTVFSLLQVHGERHVNKCMYPDWRQHQETDRDTYPRYP